MLQLPQFQQVPRLQGAQFLLFAGSGLGKHCPLACHHLSPQPLETTQAQSPEQGRFLRFLVSQRSI